MITRNFTSRRSARWSILLPALAAFLSFIAIASVQAQTTLTYQDGDLFLGFRSSDGTSDYVVNLGQPDQFLNASSGTTIQVTNAGIGSDLAAVFGSDWYSRVDAATGLPAVRWAVVGGRQVAAGNDPANTLYSTNRSANPWPRESDPAQSYTTSLIAALGNTFAGNKSTANNSTGLIQTAAATNSYASYQPGGANSQGISFQTWNPTNEGTPGMRLYLDRIVPGSGASTVVGIFTLSSSGALSFTAGNNPVGQLLNLSTRLDVLSGDNVLIGGFIITGSDQKKVYIRALGPSLAKLGVQAFLSDPTLDLLVPGQATPIYSNDDWQQQSDATQIAAITATTIPPDDAKESAMVETLAPGNYTAVVRGTGGATGVGEVEIYDISQAVNAQLGNLSTRGFVETGEKIMIGGLIVGPSNTLPARVLIRGLGPSLAAQNVPNTLADPTLDLRDVNGTSVATNDNWQDSQQAEITATGIPPSDTHEAAIVATLPAGNYTALLSGVGDGQGNGLVEIYNLQ